MEPTEKLSAYLFLVLLAIALLLATPPSEAGTPPERLDTVAVTTPPPVR